MPLTRVQDVHVDGSVTIERGIVVRDGNVIVTGDVVLSTGARLSDLEDVKTRLLALEARIGI